MTQIAMIILLSLTAGILIGMTSVTERDHPTGTKFSIYETATGCIYHVSYNSSLLAYKCPSND